MSKGFIMGWSIRNTAVGWPNIRPRKINTWRCRTRSRGICGLHPTRDLLVLALLSLAEPLVARVRHRRFDPGSTRQGVPNTPGRLPISHESAASAVGREAILLQVAVADVDLLRPLPSTRASRWGRSRRSLRARRKDLRHAVVALRDRVAPRRGQESLDGSHIPALLLRPPLHRPGLDDLTSDADSMRDAPQDRPSQMPASQRASNRAFVPACLGRLQSTDSQSSNPSSRGALPKRRS